MKKLILVFSEIAFVIFPLLYPYIAFAQTYECRFNSTTQRCEISNSTCTSAHESSQCGLITLNGISGCSPGGTQTCVLRSVTGGGRTTDGGMIDLNALIGSIGGRIPELTTLGVILTALLPIFYGLAGIGLLIFLIYSGFSFLTSSGDPKKMEAAKGQITAAVLGFILIIAAFWITQIVNYIFGLGSGF